MKSKKSVKKDIAVFPDFCSSGIWVHPRGCMIDYEDLGISKGLQKEFEEWIRFYDDECTGRPSYCVLKKKEKVLNSRGTALAKKLKAEFPHMTIYYWPDLSTGMGTLVEIK